MTARVPLRFAANPFFSLQINPIAVNFIMNLFDQFRRYLWHLWLQRRGHNVGTPVVVDHGLPRGVMIAVIIMMIVALALCARLYWTDQ